MSEIELKRANVVKRVDSEDKAKALEAKGFVRTDGKTVPVVSSAEEVKELKEQLETEDAPAVFTNKSSLGIWQRNDPETYQWFCDTYKLNNRFSFYNEEFRYFTKR